MPVNPYPGTTYEKSHGLWKARLMRAGRRINLGYFPTQEEAYAAIEAAKQRPFPPPATEPPLPPDHVAQVAKARQNKTVAQHNLLVEAPITQTALEARIFALMLRSIRKGDTVPETVVIPLEDLYPSGTYGGQQHQLLHEAMGRMMSATIRIPKLNEVDLHLVSLCDSMRLDSANKVLVAKFGPSVMPYLVDLVGHFTVANVDELLTLKSATSHRLYWLMRSWQFKSPHTVTVERLRALTTGTNYARYNDYRDKVLHPSIEELNALSFDITYKEKKFKGRTVTSIEFSIGEKQVVTEAAQLTLPLLVHPAKPQLTDQQQKVQTRLTKLKLTEAQIRKVLQVLTTEAELTMVLKETYPLLRDYETKAKPQENVAAAAMMVLKSTFPAVWSSNKLTDRGIN